MTTHRNALVLILVAALAATSLTTPAFAEKNTGAYKKSAEAFKTQLYNEFCAGVKGDLDHAESEADKVAGTKAAAPWAKRADDAWKMGHDAGCSWAA